MRAKVSLGLIVLLSLSLLIGSASASGRYARRFPGKKTEATKKKTKAKKDTLKPFRELIKDKVVIEGLFTFYHDTTDNSMLMAIKPEQIGPLFLCVGTRSGSEGAVYDNAAMGRAFPFFFKRVGKKIFMIEKNLRFRADTASALYKALAHGISDHLYASTKIKSKPDDSTGAILVDPSVFFIRDADHVSYYLGKSAKVGFSFDKENSYFTKVVSFPQNTEIDVKLHYKTSKPFPAETMQNPYSMFHLYHYSLTTLPETDYVPRLADDRVGYFLTMYEDYTNLDKETPYVRYIQRWYLKKKNPEAEISDPVEPIVFWVENTVPPEYRQAVAEGIEFWQPAFEKIGFSNAIIAKQMPDTATWDPADVRYNTVRWIVLPGGSYAVGPSHANPFTGQIYDADIRVCADFIRYMFNNMEYFIQPVSLDGKLIEPDNFLLSASRMSQNPYYCTYGAESAKEAAFGLTYVLSDVDDLATKDSLTKEYVHSYIVELVAHEVGHTLGLRHNFKASTIYSLEQINDPTFTREHALAGTIMDYNPPNIAGHGKPQGEFYSSVPGPYDQWAIEYGYKDFGAKTPEEELPMLQEIASRAPQPELTYGTDEDAFGSSPKSIDPMCNLFDLGNDPLAFCEHKVKLTKYLWENSLSKFEQTGEGYQKVLRAFQTGWRSYYESARYAAKYIGGIYHHRYHVGDPGGGLPFQPVPASEQRRAMAFLKNYIFAPDAFSIPPDVLNKLQPERLPDFTGSIYSLPQIDYPLHRYVLSVQQTTLNMLYSTYILGRLITNVERYHEGEEIYTLDDMFNDVRKAIWSELTANENINSFRRQLQMVHLERIINIYLSSPSSYPFDARSLAANDLDIIENAAKKAMKSSSINGMTRAHLKEVLRQIAAAKSAKRSFAADRR